MYQGFFSRFPKRYTADAAIETCGRAEERKDLLPWFSTPKYRAEVRLSSPAVCGSWDKLGTEHIPTFCVVISLSSPWRGWSCLLPLSLATERWPRTSEWSSISEVSSASPVHRTVFGLAGVSHSQLLIVGARMPHTTEWAKLREPAKVTSFSRSEVISPHTAKTRFLEILYWRN